MRPLVFVWLFILFIFHYYIAQNNSTSCCFISHSVMPHLYKEGRQIYYHDVIACRRKFQVCNHLSDLILFKVRSRKILTTCNGCFNYAFVFRQSNFASTIENVLFTAQVTLYNCHYQCDVCLDDWTLQPLLIMKNINNLYQLFCCKSKFQKPMR